VVFIENEMLDEEERAEVSIDNPLRGDNMAVFSYRIIVKWAETMYSLAGLLVTEDQLSDTDV